MPYDTRVRLHPPLRATADRLALVHAVRDRDELSRIFTELAAQVATDLQRKGYGGRTIGIKLRFEKVPPGQIRQKAMLDLSSKTATYATHAADPMYYICADVLERRGFDVVPVPEDSEGPGLDALERGLLSLLHGCPRCIGAQPMGAEHEANITLDRAGSPRAAGGLSVIPRDMARFGMLIRDGGMGAVDAEFMADVYTGGSHQQWADGDFADVFDNGVYRSCCYRPGEDPDVIMGIGIYGQMLYIDRPRGVVIAKQSSWATPDEGIDHNDAYRLCREIARSLG